MTHKYPEFLSLGASSLVYIVHPKIVVKVPFKGADDGAWERENEAINEINRHGHCHHLALSLLRTPQANFMLFYSGGTLEARLRANQIRGPSSQVLEVKAGEPAQLIQRWIQQLCSAAAFLESINLAHGDIRPENLFLDKQDDLKLGDFDCAKSYGFPLETARYPYARWRSIDAGDDDNTLGKLGAQSELFAIGSTYYYMLHGYEVYGNEWFGDEHGPTVVDRLQQKKFPQLKEGEESSIIQACWNGEIASIRTLSNWVNKLPGAVPLSGRRISLISLWNKKRICRQLIKNGVLEQLQEF